MKSAIYSDLYTNVSLESLVPTCSTGNCTWPDHDSLGVCVSIANVSNQLTSTSGQDEDGVTSTLTLPDGASDVASISSDSGEGTIFNMSSTPLGSNARTAFTDITSPIVDVSIIYTNQTSYPGYRALEAVFSYCVYTLKANVENGQPSVSKKGVYSNFSNDAVDPPGSGLFARPSGDLIYMVDGTARDALASSLVTILNGNFSTTGDSEYYSSDSAQVVENALTSPPYDIKGLAILFDNLAISMTNK